MTTKATYGGSHGGGSQPLPGRSLGKQRVNPHISSGSKIASSRKEEETQQQGSTSMENTTKCIPKRKEIPTLQIHTEGLHAHIQHMRNHALIGEFVGI